VARGTATHGYCGAQGGCGGAWGDSARLRLGYGGARLRAAPVACEILARWLGFGAAVDREERGKHEIRTYG
jgi:hypothetical protein